MTTALAPDLLESAREAIAEYNAIYEAGGEIDYQAWADEVIKESEELRREALGRTA